MKKVNIAIYHNIKSNETLTVHSEGNLYSSKSKKKKTCTLHEEFGESKEISLDDSTELLKHDFWRKISSWATITIED